MTEKDEAQLLARAADLFAAAERGEITHTAFLTPREQKRLEAQYAGRRDSCFFAGGYAAAERKRMFFLPDYLSCLEGEAREAFLAEAIAPSLVALAVRGSGYRTLTHRDYLGAVLNLGIERDAIGDISVTGPAEAVLLTDTLMARFLEENLTHVSRDAVRVAAITLPQDFDGGRKFEQRVDTVASPRADAVVAALCNLSRERAQALFAAALVEVDYEPLEKYDREIAAGAVITVRGHGKFIVRSLSDKTKKGRYRLVADRYV